jgi:hypothetical protein
MIVAQKLKASVLRDVSELSRLLDYSAIAYLASCFPFRHKKITQSITSVHRGLSGPFLGLPARPKLEQPRPSLCPLLMPGPIVAVVFRVDFVDFVDHEVSQLSFSLGYLRFLIHPSYE